MEYTAGASACRGYEAGPGWRSNFSCFSYAVAHRIERRPSYACVTTFHVFSVYKSGAGRGFTKRTQTLSGPVRTGGVGTHSQVFPQLFRFRQFWPFGGNGRLDPPRSSMPLWVWPWFGPKNPSGHGNGRIPAVSGDLGGLCCIPISPPGRSGA